MFVNLTPHAISVADESGNSLYDVPPSGVIPRVSVGYSDVGEVEGVPVVRAVYGAVEDLPEPVEGTVFIVSGMVRERISNRNDVVSPDTGPTCLREDGRIVAVTRFVTSMPDNS